MKILVINSGSSSIKYKLFEMDGRKVLAFGLVEKIGETTGIHTHHSLIGKGEEIRSKWSDAIPNHREGFGRIIDLLLHPDHGAIQSKSEISAVGHRVVHGGESLKSPSLIDEKVVAVIEKNISLAPLHNPSNLTGIEVSRAIFPDSPQVAVFDTAFHQTMPPKAFMYALPYAMYQCYGIRRYGFHGTSHAYVAESSAQYLERPLNELNLITIHLGNGASMAAIEQGKCVDTTMGMTPLEGLVMGSRSGDVDPALPLFLATRLKMTLKEIDDLLNKESGLKGLCGTNDMREVLEREKAGHERAKMALDVYTYRIKKYIGAYYAILGDVDAVVFTAGIGENAPEIRERCCSGLSRFGIHIDSSRNNGVVNGTTEISPPDGEVKILVAPTDEELKIAIETKKVIDKERCHGCHL